MAESELVFRILRLNRIPARRVLFPGPATSFPIALVEPSGQEIQVESLIQARAIGGAVAGRRRQKNAQGYFAEALPLGPKVTVHVNGLSAVTDKTELPSEDREAVQDLGIRAAYALGMDAARIEVVLADDGPTVVSAEAYSAQHQKTSIPPRFLGLRAQFLAFHPDTGLPMKARPFVAFDRDGKLLGWEGAGGVWEGVWVSSPMPYPGLPLCTELLFAGEPTAGYIKALDRTLAVPAMLASPLHESRERHGTREGTLGRYKRTDQGFSYLSVPGILWNPKAVSQICGAARDLESGDSSLSKDLSKEYYRQRAYYRAIRSAFAGEGFPGVDPPESDEHTLDIRPLWGERAPSEERGFAVDTSNLPVPCLVSVGLEGGGVSVSRVTSPLPDILRPSAEEIWMGRCRVRPNRALGRDLCLLPSVTYRARPGSGSFIHIGPAVGILSPPRESGARFGIETARFERLASLGAQIGLFVFVFFPERTGEVTWGYTYREGGWERRRVPVPDVIYDRYLGGDPWDPAAALDQRYRGILWLNSHAFARLCRDKIASHLALSEDPLIRSSLPVTHELQDPKDAYSFAAAHRRTFLKLRSGHGSSGLVVIDNLGDDRFQFMWRGRDGSPETKGVRGASEFLSWVTGALVGPEGGYVVQEGIDMAGLPQGSGGTFEVRVIYQKGGYGRWLRTGMVARVNPTPEPFMIPGQEIHKKVGEVLGSVFPGRQGEIQRRIRDLARLVPPSLERHGGRGGEASVDIGVDKKGQLFIIEVNSKPATLFRDIGAFGIRDLCHKRILNYAIKLASQEGEQS